MKKDWITDYISDHQKEIVNFIIKHQEESLSNYGFYIHCVFGDIYEITYHTHHVNNVLGLPYDIMITAQIPTEDAHTIIYDIVTMMKFGFIFEDDKKYSLMNNRYKFKVKVNQYDKNYLVILIPDKNDKYPGDIDCSEYSCHQLDENLLTAHEVHYILNTIKGEYNYGNR